jgi:hypothetical protein
LWETAFTTYGGDNNNFEPNTTKIAEAFDRICPDSSCASIIIDVESYKKYDINKYNLDLLDSSCNSSALYNKPRFHEMNLTSYLAIELTESYYTCHPTIFDAVTYAIGISTSNGAVGTTIVMFVAFFILGRYMSFRYQYTTGFGELIESGRGGNVFGGRSKRQFGGGSRSIPQERNRWKYVNDNTELIESLQNQVKTQQKLIETLAKKLSQHLSLPVEELLTEKKTLPSADIHIDSPSGSDQSRTKSAVRIEKRDDHVKLSIEAIDYFKQHLEIKSSKSP